ncbi:LysR family transcriptional regulator [Marinomonas sp.]|uniref:LysR family transcriptional regulator n=1 Tax=Marinomonas sp. TaxID=1904862 RepID=UPI003A943946
MVVVNTDNSLLDTKQLRLFEALYRSGSVTKTAEILDLSQPTVSLSLAKLRKDCDDPLFVRTNNGMLPTPKAEYMINNVQKILSLLEQVSLFNLEFDPRMATREFRIAMTDASHITLLPTIQKKLQEVAPNISIKVIRFDMNLEANLQNGEADLAIGLLPDLDTGFYQQTLFPQDWVCLVKQAHPRINHTLTIDQYMLEKHIGIVSGTGAPLLEEALKKSSIERDVALKIPGFLGLGGLLTETDLVATLPRHIATTLSKHYQLKLIECPFWVEQFTVKQYWHQRYHHDSASRWLRMTCAELFQENNSGI